MPAATAREASWPPIGAATRRRLAGFVRTLRDNGFAVGLAETRDALSVLASRRMAFDFLKFSLGQTRSSSTKWLV